MFYNEKNTSSNNNNENSKCSRENLVKLLSEQKPSVKNEIEALAVLIHSLMKLLGFTFLGNNEDKIDENENKHFLSENWNQTADFYSFLYRHPEASSTPICIKILKMGQKAMISGMKHKENNIYSIEVTLSDLIEKVDNFTDFEKVVKKNTQSFVDNFANRVLENLIPSSLVKIAYVAKEETKNTSLLREDDPLRIPNNSGRGRGSLYPTPYVPYGEPFSESGPNSPSVPSFGSGSQDLSPFPLKQPNISGRGGDTGGGSLIGPQNPIFGPLVTDPNSGGLGQGGLGRGRGKGKLPPSHPPGARFDPFGPGPNFGDPDNDELNPPGNMYG